MPNWPPEDVDEISMEELEASFPGIFKPNTDSEPEPFYRARLDVCTCGKPWGPDCIFEQDREPELHIRITCLAEVTCG